MTREKESTMIQVLTIFLIMALVITQLCGIGTVYAATLSNTVTFTEQLYSYYPDGTHPVNNQHGIFRGTLNDNPIFCGNHSKLSPVGESIGDSKTLAMHEYNSKVMIDKILYYGYGGPKQWTGFNESEYYSPYKGGTTAKKKQWMGISVTSMALTRAYGTSGYWYEISGLPEFWEYVKDADAPPNGFQTYIMYGNDNEQDLFTFIYEPEAYLNLTKSVTKKTEDSIAGAEYGVYSDSALSKKVGTLKTKSDGSSNKLTLAPGTYYVKETKAPKGWRLDTEIYKVKLKEDKATAVKSTEAPQEGYGKLLKGIAENDQLVAECPQQYSLAGAEYSVYSSKSMSSSDKVGTLKTNADGSTNTLTLKPGTYYVKETKSPKGFVLDTKIYDLIIQDAKTTTLKVFDKPRFDPMTIMLTKVDKNGTGMPIEGAEFTVKYYKVLADKMSDLKGLEPAKTWVLKTNKAGTIGLHDNYKVSGDSFYKSDSGVAVGLIGTYVFTETKAPAGYAAMEGSVLRQVTEGGTTSVTVYNEPVIDEYPQTVSISLQKIDAETGKTIPQGYASFEGAKYEVIDDSGKSVGTIITDKNGKGTLTNLKPGTYKVHEIKAPKGYLVNKETITVEAKIKEINTANFDYKIESEETVTKTEILKYEVVDGQKVPVRGAALQVINEKGTVVEEFMTTDCAYVLKGLAAGKYILHEKTAPAGYVTAPDVEFEVKEGEEITRVEMEDDIIKVDIEKVDRTTKKMIPGAQLQVIDESGSVIEEWVSEDEPHRISRLPKGVYTLCEVSAPKGYIAGDDVTFEVRETENVQTFTIENDYIKVEVFKVDKNTRNVIPGTELTVVPLDGEEKALSEQTYALLVTDEDGKIKLDRIPAGKYAIKETGTNFGIGYVTAEDIVIEVKSTTDLQTFTMEDDCTKLEISKTDIVTGEPVVGAQLSIIPLNENGQPETDEITASWVTTDEPHYIEYIPVGDYILRETIAPFENGYVTAEDVKFTVKDTGVIQKVEMKDSRTKVEFLKVDMDTGKPLAKAQFELYNEENVKVAEWVSTEESYRIEGLPVGDYILKETKVPEGYSCLSEKETIEIKDTDDVQIFKIENKKIQKVSPPDTSDGNKLIEYGTAAVIALTVLVILLKNKEKYKKP